MIEAYNAYTPAGGLTFQDMQFNTSGVSSFIDLNTQGFPITFTHTNITLGYSGGSTGWFFTEGAQTPSNQWRFNDSTIHLGRSGDPAGINVLGLVFQDFPGPNKGLFDGTGTSRNYDFAGNLITDLGALHLQERGSNPPYPTYYQNGFDFWTSLPGNAFVGSFVTSPLATPVPEPSSLVLAGICGLSLALGRRQVVGKRRGLEHA